ncbi:PDZ domain-containing protein [Candidatus Aerophobetes bacterium]|uniref:PDZ domain-containing protein n=1 Tax=Aerophobetes bacterium TaxID=2030807 RepID=A0A523Y550_UNCAE|nr:MAG: PDZ domain-containing protein [Candidatus Aerophobetes bacterium]
MFERLSASKMFRFPFVFWMVLVGGLVAVGIGLVSLGYPVPATELKGLEGTLYQESKEVHSISPDSLEGMIVNTVELVSPAVVSISTERTVASFRSGQERSYGERFENFDEFFRRFFRSPEPRREFKQKGLGSGMIINENGYILTNQHVIHQVDEGGISITLSDGRILDAEIVETDLESDLAVLKIRADSLPVVTLGDSDNLRVGQWAIAIGNPFGYALSELNQKYEPTVTVGVISARERAMQIGGTGTEVRVYTDLIQTDASINPGNSGGPLVNIHGEVIGINSAILSPSGVGSIGIGFAVPINKAKRILDSLVKYGKIEWPWIGIYMQPELTEDLAKRFGVERGVLVTEVVESSPAKKAGVKAGDVIQKVNGKDVNSPLDLKNEILKLGIGEEIVLALVREKEQITIALTTGRIPEEIVRAEEEEKEEEETEKEIEEALDKAPEETLLGIKVQPITSELREKYNLAEDEQGVVVTQITPASPAMQAGIEPGDVIKEVEQKKITDIDDFREAIQEVKPGEIILLRVRHGVWTMYITVPTNK